jgi:hypothetical protein
MHPTRTCGAPLRGDLSAPIDPNAPCSGNDKNLSETVTVCGKAIDVRMPFGYNGISSSHRRTNPIVASSKINVPTRALIR